MKHLPIKAIIIIEMHTLYFNKIKQEGGIGSSRRQKLYEIDFETITYFIVSSYFYFRMLLAKKYSRKNYRYFFFCFRTKNQKKEDFILQFSKRNCPHCLLLEKTEKEFLRKNEIKIFRFQIDENQKDFNENQEFIISNFPDLDMVPSVYWMEKGRAENQLPIIEEDQYLVLKKWITDNQNYYKEGG